LELTSIPAVGTASAAAAATAAGSATVIDASARLIDP
jgi:hypothetical protein